MGGLRLRRLIRFAQRFAPLRTTNHPDRRLLQAEAFAHEALQAGFVKEIVGEFFVRKHGEGGALGAGGQFGGFFHGEAGILADDRRDHADHQLEAADAASLVLGCILIGFGAGSEIGFLHDLIAPQNS